MVILHIASIDNNRFNGVPRAVPQIINAQKETGEAEIAFLNVRDIRIEGLDCQLFPGKLSLKELKYPFNEPDIVIFHEVYYPPFLKLSEECRKNNIPYVIIPHGCLTGEAQNIKKWKKRIGNELLFKRFVMDSAGLQFLSDSEKKRTIFDKKGFIAANGIELPERVEDLKQNFEAQRALDTKFDNQLRFTYIGRIDPHIKGLDIMIEAVAEEQEFFRKNACSFALYGPDPSGKRQELRAFTVKLNVADLIKINDAVDEERKKEILLSSDVFLQFSRSEALPTGILEALSYGLPCVVSKGTGLAGLINTYDAGWGENGYQTLSELLKKAIEERSTYPEKSRNARKLIKERFERKRCARRMISVYSKILEKIQNCPVSNALTPASTRRYHMHVSAGDIADKFAAEEILSPVSSRIPKIIHYCWFGKKEIPSEFKKYIEGWKKLCPDFEIREWNEDNFDYKRSRYARETYKAGKWAFVSDYARFRILYDYGGIYLDTDVELVKSLDGLLTACAEEGITGFMGIERPETGDVAPGLICAAEPHNPLIKELLLGYKDRRFNLENGKQNMTSVVEYTTEFMKNKGFDGKNEICDIENFRIYPAEYFNPMDMNTGKITITDNTYSIHHYASSWVDGYSKFRGKIYKLIRKNLGEKAATKTRRFLGR